MQRYLNELTDQFQACAGGSQDVRTSTGSCNTTRIINSILPPGWFPLAAWPGWRKRSVLPALLATSGPRPDRSGISLRRAYRTGLKLYTGGVHGCRSESCGRDGARGSDRPQPGAVSRTQIAARFRAGVGCRIRRVPVLNIACPGSQNGADCTDLIMLVVFGGIFWCRMRRFTPPSGALPVAADRVRGRRRRVCSSAASN